MGDSSRDPFIVLTAAVRTALRQWHQCDQAETAFRHLYLYRKLCCDRKLSGRLAINALLLTGLEQLQAQDERAAQLIRTRFLDCRSVTQAAHQRNVAESTIFALQRRATEQLSEILLREDAACYADQQTRMLQRLELLNHEYLVGVESSLTALLPLFQPDGSPWLIVLEGRAGIGKTTFANLLLRRLIDLQRVDEIGWVRARPQHFSPRGEWREITTPALTAEQLIEALCKQFLPEVVDHPPPQRLPILQRHLREMHHVIVIDNLETSADVEALLPTLQQLANPTRFVLTTCDRLGLEPSLYHFKLPALDASDALLLIRQAANLCSLPVLAAAPDVELLPIYETVGGNPLALRLVVGQTHLYLLGALLAYLRAACNETIDKLYTDIYWRAWQQLDEVQRRVLLAMPFAHPEGDELDYLAEIVDLPLEEMRRTLNRLVILNLVNAHGGLTARRYGIHGLTRTFLVKQIGQWL